ncbi:Crp/Fnr family transcriptional regulator [Alistipes sp. OttesenSCG-928-B03]|nr:Crp/Fnr family transcriptional regulator [Alistipes sp. OttesenSCG-928-B03]
MKKLVAELSRYGKLGRKEKQLLEQNVRTLRFPKDAVVIGKGKIDDSIYIIRRGVWRAYIDRDGEQLTLWFAVPGESILSPWGYIKGVPSRYNVVASSDSEALEIKKTTIQELVRTAPFLWNWLHEMALEELLNADDMLVDISDPKAEKRYLALMKKAPVIFQNVPLKEIAGFIGVTPQSLSRIRAKIRTTPADE